jgi:Family of unknown function (DUF6493)
MTPEELGAAIDEKNAAAVTALLLTASEPERIRCASAARKRLGRPSSWYANYDDLTGLNRLTEDERERALERYNQRVRDRRHEAAVPALAVLGTARSPRQAAQALEMIDNDTEQQAVTVLAQRPSAWLADFCEQAFASQSGAPVTEWRLVRALVRAGHVTRPRSPSYITAIPFGLTHFDRPDRPELRDALLADPALLQEEIFELFTVDEAGALLLTQDNYHDKSHWHHDGSTHPERTWRVTLAGLAADGHATGTDCWMPAWARSSATSRPASSPGTSGCTKSWRQTRTNWPRAPGDTCGCWPPMPGLPWAWDRTQ